MLPETTLATFGITEETNMPTAINEMKPLSIITQKENRYHLPQYHVHLLHGTPGEGGVVVDTLHVTKKWERVEAAIDQLLEQSKHYSNQNTGEWFVRVDEVATVSSGDFTQ